MCEVRRIRFTVPGRPVPAVRMTRGGKHVSEDRAQSTWARDRARRIERHLQQKDDIGWEAAQAVRALNARMPMFEGDVRVSMRFYIARTRGSLPDLNNLVKLAEDALNGIVWQDDIQVAQYGEMERIVCSRAEQRTEIEVEELPGEPSARPKATKGKRPGSRR